MIRRPPTTERLPRGLREWQRFEPLRRSMAPLAPPGHLDLPPCVVGVETDPVWDACAASAPGHLRLVEHFTSSPLEDRALREGVAAMRRLEAALRTVSGARLCARVARTVHQQIQLRLGLAAEDANARE